MSRTSDRRAGPDPTGSRHSPLLRSTLECAACGWRAPAREPYPFRCRRAEPGDDLDHVLQRRLELPDAASADSARAAFDAAEPNPFVRFRGLLHSYLAARQGGLDDAALVGLAERLDRRIAAVAGARLRATPCEPSADLARALGVDRVWVKNETGNPSGSHKVRHMAGLALWLAQVERRIELGRSPQETRRDAPWAIASCGNAALAAAVVARASDHQIEVFVPEHAHPAVLHELEHLNARIRVCRRAPGEVGDPCYLALRRAVAEGSLPFSCQGNENGLVIEGGSTLIWEMIARWRRESAELDRLFVQVGGGALATACIRGLFEARQLGLVPRLPRIHAVQTAAAHPLVRAWDRLSRELLTLAAEAPGSSVPERLADPARPADRAAWLSDNVPTETVLERLRCAAHARSRYMRPWESEPRSIATGILDDETYDWHAVARGMLLTGGCPIVVSEERLAGAHRLARGGTGIPADPTGTAGLAGACELAESGELGEGERLAVLLTGAERGS